MLSQALRARAREGEWTEYNGYWPELDNPAATDDATECMLYFERGMDEPLRMSLLVPADPLNLKTTVAQNFVQ